MKLNIYYPYRAEKLVKRLEDEQIAEYCIRVGRPFKEYVCKLRFFATMAYVYNDKESLRRYYSGVTTEPIYPTAAAGLVHYLLNDLGKPAAVEAFSDDVTREIIVDGSECKDEDIAKWIKRNMDVIEIKPSKASGYDDVLYVPKLTSEGYVIDIYKERVSIHVVELIKVKDLIKVLRRKCSEVEFSLR